MRSDRLSSLIGFLTFFFLLFLWQQKSRKKMCILAIVCSVALVILGIIIWQVSK